MTKENEELIREIYADVQVIKNKLENDYKTIYGNGKTGLVDRVAKLEQDNTLSCGKAKWYREWLGWIMAGVMFIVSNIDKLNRLF